MGHAIKFKQKRPLTPAQLRTFKGYENISDEEAKNIIQSVQQFTIIAYQLFQKLNQAYYEQPDTQIYPIHQQNKRKAKNESRKGRDSKLCDLHQGEYKRAG